MSRQSPFGAPIKETNPSIATLAITHSLIPHPRQHHVPLQQGSTVTGTLDPWQLTQLRPRSQWISLANTIHHTMIVGPTQSTEQLISL